jgi:hypothetical protein
MLVNITMSLFTQRTLQTGDEEIAKFYITIKNASELHFQTHILDIFEGLKIINNYFIYNNIFSAIYYFPKILYTIQKLQLSFDKSTLDVECKNAKEISRLSCNPEKSKTRYIFSKI